MGEQLYQLRSELDACIYQATIYGTMQDPPPNEGRLEFPITYDATEWPNLAKRRLSALPKPIQDAIERVQPYNNLSLSSEETVKSVNRSLGILHDLARKDRHSAFDNLVHNAKINTYCIFRFLRASAISVVSV